jgi:superfamily I DNA and RNA helicase
MEFKIFQFFRLMLVHGFSNLVKLANKKQHWNTIGYEEAQQSIMLKRTLKKHFVAKTCKKVLCC